MNTMSFSISIALLFGRIIFGIYWINTAYGHLWKAGGLVGYTQSKGVKSASMAKLAVYGTGLLALVGGLTILLGYRPHYGVACIVVFLLGVSYKIHDYWNAQDPAQKMSERVNFMKNMALLGATLMLLAIAQPWPFSL